MSVNRTSATAAAGVDRTRALIAGSIKQAASTGGTNLRACARYRQVDSNFDPTPSPVRRGPAGCFSSSTRPGLATVKEAGAHRGYGQYADGNTRARMPLDAIRTEPVRFPTGTRAEIRFGPADPKDDDTLR
jgi:hypothetical protein